ncbi:unnamed protein product [Parascedosporium putredinis]|uniref:Linoleate diol synthase n=1 Tax=Parascedosporium putredinis TaxID=1442378 RepID=A0A9P1H2Q4_9PEZI|nr:unnamed protein product [Parascedosporium putredinis]CAI7996291.1 unnamed protein product [Parascedosporium putredinis]
MGVPNGSGAETCVPVCAWTRCGYGYVDIQRTRRPPVRAPSHLHNPRIKRKTELGASMRRVLVLLLRGSRRGEGLGKKGLSSLDKHQAKTVLSEVNGSSSSGPAAPAKFTPVGATDGGPLAAGPKAVKEPSFKATLKMLSKRPLPTDLGGGRYRVVETRPKLGKDLSTISMADVKTLVEMVKNKLRNRGITDDKTMIMERVIGLVADLPHQSRLRENLTNSFLTELWNTLDHPPLLYIGDLYRFRTADGSHNNPLLPNLGAAGSTYARSVRPGKIPLGALPDPEQVFEAVMARREYKKHPNNVSSILWYWASIIIHDLFWTDYRDSTKTKTSSYLDLSPLYGSNQTMQDSIRTFKDGLLKVDSFADKRLIGMPPGVPVLLIMFNRFHNYVAKNLAEINEGGRFTKPRADLPEGPAKDAAWKKYDEELFQTARLVTSGLHHVDAGPRQEMGINVGTKDGAERGTGNIVSAEFNLCYRWHSCISDKDDKWIREFYGSILGDRAETMTTHDMMVAFVQYERSIPDDPVERTFGGYERDPVTKRFNDDELVDCIASAVEDPAGAFGARNVPRVMKPIEIMGILQGRKWNCAGLNEFRKQFGLKPYETFEDINPDEDVASHLRHLYQHPDNVELYPGLVSEAAKAPMVPGVGIAPTYTISRVVLSDAVCLVRGDRFYTTEYHPRGLTSWGYKEVEYDLDLNHGCVFYKLFIRAFPNHFKPNSVYAHYPMVTPKENLNILTSLRRADRFDWERPRRQGERVVVGSHAAAKYVLANPGKYRPASCDEGLAAVLGKDGARFKVSAIGGGGSEPQQQCLGTKLRTVGWQADVKAFYAEASERILARKSYRMGGTTQVDLVRDVGNLLPVHFASRVFALPLKSEENPRGVFAEQELYRALAVIYARIFSDDDPVASFPRLQDAKAEASRLGQVIEGNIKSLRSGSSVAFAQKLNKKDALSGHGRAMVKELAKEGLSNHEIAWGQVLPTLASLVPNQAEVRPSSEDTDAVLLGYAMEGIRLAGNAGLDREATVHDVIVEADGREVPISPGDRVFTSSGPDECLTLEATRVGITELFRALFRRRNVRRVPGPQGQLKKVARPDGTSAYLTEDWATFTPFPASMKVMWDEDEDVGAIRV